MEVCVFILLISAVFAKHEEYSEWKSYFVEPSSYDQLKILYSISQELDLDIYSHATIGREGLIFVGPQSLDRFTHSLNEFGIKYRVHAEDLHSYLNHEEKILKAKSTKSSSRIGGKLSYSEYQSLETIYKYLDDIAEEYPELVKLESPKNSFNGLPIKYLKISKSNFEDSTKPIIFLDGGFHGREWLSIPPTTFAINQLVENVTDSELLEKFDWIILPIANPDSYKHSRDVNVVWRKTRSYIDNPLSRMCPGVDLDRNFDIHWNIMGTSNVTCSYIYAGTHAFSEVEATLVQDILRENSRILMYVSFSSFGSLIMYPWAYDGALTNHAFSQHTVGITIADTINRMKLPTFFDYRVGNAGMIRGSGMSGTSIDYAYEAGVPLAYSIELPGLFGGYFMNPIYIEQVCLETWEGLKVGVKRAGEIFGK